MLSNFETLVTGGAAAELLADLRPAELSLALSSPRADTGHPHVFGCGAAEGIAARGGKSEQPSGEPGGAWTWAGTPHLSLRSR